MSGFHSCYCGNPFYTNNPTMEKECPACLAKTKEPPPGKPKKRKPKLYFIHVCTIPNCETKIYHENRHIRIKYCRPHAKEQDLKLRKRSAAKQKAKRAMCPIKKINWRNSLSLKVVNV